MKAFVIVLALLAALKIGYQEYLYRTSTSEVVVAAYKDRAIQACQRDPKAVMFGIGPQAWFNPGSVSLVIGKSKLDVQVWQVDHELWNARYRSPYLLLTPNTRASGIYCEYDILNAAASVYRM
jgi:hypothetical protein